MHANIFICTTFINMPTSAYASNLSNLLHSQHSYANFLCMGFAKYTYIKGRVEESSLKMDRLISVKLNLCVY